MILLFDYDSLLYKAVYKIVSLSDIRKYYKEGRQREWIEREIVELSINRLCNMGDALFLEIEESGVEISSVEYFITRCSNSIRKQIAPSYKANRKPNKWVKRLRDYLVNAGLSNTSNEWEADDLIADRARELGEDNFIVCTIDKDLKQIPGLYFDYYRPILKDENGERQLDEYGDYVKAPCRGFSLISEDEAARYFWLQLLTGDASDNIKSIKGIGIKKAEKLLENKRPEQYEEITKAEYLKAYGNLNLFNVNKFLIELGTNRSILV